MTDFADAFERGQDAAALAAAARAEISGVFDEVNTQLQTATDGRIEIDRHRFEKTQKEDARRSVWRVRRSVTSSYSGPSGNRAVDRSEKSESD